MKNANGHFNGHITLGYLRDILSYSKKTGHFFWNDHADISARARHLLGKGIEAGGVRGNGYRYITISGKSYLVSRLAHFYVTGYWPEKNIDHKNRNSLKNNWANLRPASQANNMANIKKTAHNRSGYKGVGFSKEKKKWRAYITINYRYKHLGYFASKKKASAAYIAATKKHNGEFATW